MCSLLYPRKHNAIHSKFIAPLKDFSRNSKTHLIPIRYDQEQQKEKTSAEAKPVGEFLRSKRKRNLVEMGPPPSDRNVKKEFAQVYPFVVEAVSFNFGDDYGNRMFLDLEKEFSFESDNCGRGLCADVFAAVDHLSDDVFLFSSKKASPIVYAESSFLATVLF